MKLGTWTWIRGSRQVESDTLNGRGLGLLTNWPHGQFVDVGYCKNVILFLSPCCLICSGHVESCTSIEVWACWRELDSGHNIGTGRCEGENCQLNFFDKNAGSSLLLLSSTMLTHVQEFTQTTTLEVKHWDEEDLSGRRWCCCFLSFMRPERTSLETVSFGMTWGGISFLHETPNNQHEKQTKEAGHLSRESLFISSKKVNFVSHCLCSFLAIRK